MNDLRAIVSKLSDRTPSGHVRNWIDLAQSTEAFIKQIADQLADNPTWLDRHPSFLNEELPQIVQSGILGRMPLRYLLSKMSLIPAESRSILFTEQVGKAASLFADLALTHIPPEQEPPFDDKVTRAFLHACKSSKDAVNLAKILLDLGEEYHPVASTLLERFPAKEIKPKIQTQTVHKAEQPKPVKKPQVPSGHSQKGLRLLNAFPHMLRGPERLESLARFSQRAADIASELTLFELARVCERFHENRYCASSFFKAAAQRSLVLCERLSAKPNHLEPDQKNCLLTLYTTLINHYYSSPALNNRMHTLHNQGVFEHCPAMSQQLIIAFANCLPDETFLTSWEREVATIGAAEPSSIRFIAAGTMRGGHIPPHWVIESGDEPFQRNIKSQNIFEASVFGAAQRVCTAYGISHDIYAEYFAGGFSIDFVLSAQGKRIGFECDGDIFHYIHESPANGMTWQEYLREWYIQHHVGIPLIRIPQSIWPQGQKDQDLLIQSELKKLLYLPLSG